MTIRTALATFFVRVSAARVLILLVVHLVVFAACYFFAWLIRFDFQVPSDFEAAFTASFPVVVLVQLLIGGFFGFYRGWWSYAGISDVIRLTAGLTASLAVLLTVWYVEMWSHPGEKVFFTPRGVLLVDWAFCLLVLFGARVLARIARARFRPFERATTSRRVLIIGAGDAGEALAREIEQRPQLGMRVAAFVDDHRPKWHSQIRGIGVTGPISDVGKIAAFRRATEALIAIPSAPGSRIREIIHHLSSAGLPFRTMPGFDRIVSGEVSISQLRNVDVEDLLRRKRIDLPGEPVRQMFAGKRVMITGSGGTIGSELASQVARLELDRLLLVERSEHALYEVGRMLAKEAPQLQPRIASRLIDIRDTDLLESLIVEERPDIVFHAAAHKHVPLGEENAYEYLRNNTLASRRLAEICSAHGVARFVFISSDKAINPSNVMGATKRAAEILLLDHARTASMTVTIVRFGNVIGSSGSAVRLFQEQIAAGGPVTVTHPHVTRYFIRSSEAISLILQAATLGSDGQIFMLDMGEPIRIADLASDLIRLSNHSEDEIPIVYTGLRPGEKVFEEIHLVGESVHATSHPQIVITEAPVPPAEQISRWIQKAANVTDSVAAVSIMKQLVPEYRPPSPAEPELPSDVLATSQPAIA